MLRTLFVLLPAFVLTGIAHAHGGFENETEVRIDSGRMRVVVRTSVAFAWTILGDRAPRTADDAGKARAKPLLAAAAPELFTVTAGGRPMLPMRTDSVFEIDEHVAFVLQFERPTGWPVTLEAKFFPLFGELDSGSIAVFDQTASRFNRDVEPLLRKTIDAKHPVVSFDLVAGTIENVAPQESPPLPAPAVARQTGRENPWIIPLSLLATALALAAWRRPRTAS